MTITAFRIEFTRLNNEGYKCAECKIIVYKNSDMKDMLHVTPLKKKKGKKITCVSPDRQLLPMLQKIHSCLIPV